MHLIAELSYDQGRRQRRERFKTEPGRAGARLAPFDQLVVRAEGAQPAGPWQSFAGGGAPGRGHHKGAVWREVHNLARADSEHRMHPKLDEQGEMSIRAQAPVCDQHVTRSSGGMDCLDLRQVVGQQGGTDQLHAEASAGMAEGQQARDRKPTAGALFGGLPKRLLQHRRIRHRAA